MIKTIYFLILITTGLFSCAGCEKSSKIKISEEVKEASEKWKDDKCGCKDDRNSKLGVTIIEGYKVNGGTYENMIEALGDPDFTSNNNVSYYYSGVCENGIMVDSADHCWLKFDVDKSTNQVKQQPFRCL